MHLRCVVISRSFSAILTLFVDINHKTPYDTVPSTPLGAYTFTSRYPPCNTFLSNTLSLTPSLNMRYRPHTLQKTITYYLYNCYRCTVGLRKEWIFISLDKGVFGWAVRVAVVQLSPGLMWTTSISFCMYLLSFTLCATV